MQERADIGKLNQTIDELAVETDAVKGGLVEAKRSLDESVMTAGRYLDEAARVTATLEEATDGLKEWMVDFGGTADLILATERDVLDKHDEFHRKSLEAGEGLRSALAESAAKVEEGQEGLYAKVAQDVTAASCSLRSDVAQAREETVLRLDKALLALEPLRGEVERLSEEASRMSSSMGRLHVLAYVLLGVAVINVVVSVAGLLF